ncbi:MAG: CBS domain-containing protein [Pseudomonadales bacterium]|nr:CBS domain-containing protein [Pseudomonadales bacterium]
MGVVSDTDFLEATSPNIGRAAETTRDLATLNKRVHQIMTRHPETIRREATLAEAIRRFDESGVSFLPVLNDDETVAGVLSWRDVIRALARAAEDGEARA